MSKKKIARSRPRTNKARPKPPAPVQASGDAVFAALSEIAGKPGGRDVLRRLGAAIDQLAPEQPDDHADMFSDIEGLIGEAQRALLAHLADIAADYTDDTRGLEGVFKALSALDCVVSLEIPRERERMASEVLRDEAANG